MNFGCLYKPLSCTSTLFNYKTLQNYSFLLLILLLTASNHIVIMFSSLVSVLSIAAVVLSSAAAPLDVKTIDDFVKLLAQNLENASQSQPIPKTGARFTDDGDLLWDDATYSFDVAGHTLNATHFTITYDTNFKANYANVATSGTTLSKGTIVSTATALDVFSYDFVNATGTLRNGWVSSIQYGNQQTVFKAYGRNATLVPSLVKFIENQIDTAYDGVLVQVLIATSEEFSKPPTRKQQYTLA